MVDGMSPEPLTEEQVDTGVKGFDLTELLPIVVVTLGILAASINAFCKIHSPVRTCETDGTVRQWSDATMSTEYTD